jgi:predicted nucleic acid-binding protein
MPDKMLVDTNVLVAAYDRANPDRQRQALDVLDRLVEAGTGYLSAQVLAEFSVYVTHMLAVPLSVAQAYERVQRFLQVWPVLEATGLVILEAVRGVREHALGYRDAQVWAVARMNQVPVVLSTELDVDRVVEGVCFVDPLAEGFVAEQWGL